MLVSKPLIMKTFETQDEPVPGSPASTTTSDAVKDPVAAQEACKLQLFIAECSLCEIIEQFVSSFVRGASQRVFLDGGRRTELYNKLLCWKLSLPESFTTGDSVLPSVLLLQSTYDFVCLKLLSAFTGTDFDGRNADALLHLHASSLVNTLWLHRSLHTLRHEYWAAEHCAFAARVLLSRLESAHDIVARACWLLCEMSAGGLSARAAQLLGEIEETARAMGVRVPAYGRASSRSPEVVDVAPGFVVRGARVFDGSVRGGVLGDRCDVAFRGNICDVRPGI
ncbi:C6 transcription factor [Colletotrichum karsti]|uniref:C6 transcription factor n=1 Tax=Colletotrichum karsti TaxID=1095194 RepID=A0A9P6IBK1_9PEZI|nr:C6 transcription factor [Colletotrichum karsti]KAF9879337.1 C6 transcription factor [Colletotrichum karsti]